MENAAEGWLKAAIVLMSRAGPRAGALPSVSISGDRYTCTTKGKEQRGKVPQEARETILKAGLSLRSPFGDKAVHQVEDSFRYLKYLDSHANEWDKDADRLVVDALQAVWPQKPG